MKQTSLIVFALAGLLLGIVGCGKSDSSGAASAKEAKFLCPMHPTYTSDRQGDCPICGMSLVPIGGGGADTGAASIPGRVSIVLAPDKRQLIGLTLSTLEKRHLVQAVRNVGVVAHDETRYARIAPRFGGWVRSLQVNYTGQAVEKGAPLFTVYSPELFTAQTDYLLAWKNAQSMSNHASNLSSPAQHLLEAARRKLELLEVSEQEIAALQERGRASDELQVRSPISGHVITRNAVNGQSFMSGDMLYEIADLSRLWLRAAVYEADLPLIREGQKARIRFANLNNIAIESTVAFIYPHIDPQTRRAEVRIEFDNPSHDVRPDMWANVEIEVDLGEVLAVPASSVIDTGSRFVAFVEGEKDHLEPREVKVGRKTDDYYEVLEGLNPGEQVVTRALFLIDSESQLKAAISGMHEH
jgi:Cu(I)/Ag(I) efflux system membrane fusion protein